MRAAAFPGLALATIAGCGTPSATTGSSALEPLPSAPTAGPRGAARAVAPQEPPPSSINAGFATALAFAPDGRLFWTQRGGAVMVWQDGGARTFATVPTVTTEPAGTYSERGLLGLAISPASTRDHYVYAFYSDVDRRHEHIIRWRDCGGTGVEATVIVTLPSGSDCCHKGGRLAFGRDGMLYVTVGDEHAASAALDTNDVRGKVLRYRPDGTVP